MGKKKKKDKHKQHEADAQASRRGMWGQAAPVHPPSYTRRRKSTL